MKTLSLLFLALMANTGIASSYGVPVPDELADYSSYSNTPASGTIKDGVLSVSYCLPEVLVGKKTPELRFTGRVTSDFIQVSGPHVHGVCMRSKIKPLTCVLRYPELRIDVASRDEALDAAFSGEALAMRREVSRLFISDPAGILSLQLAP